MEKTHGTFGRRAFRPPLPSEGEGLGVRGYPASFEAVAGSTWMPGPMLAETVIVWM